MAKRKAKKTSKQMSFFKEMPEKRHFGGSRLKSNPKTARPLNSKEAIHLVLKSSWATGSKSMLQKYNCDKIDYIIRSTAKKCEIRIYHFVNVGNHLHLVIKLDNLELYPKFIRAITGLISRHVLKRERGPVDLSGKRVLRKIRFWVARPFSRIIAWGRDFKHIKNYMEKNRGQAKSAYPAWGFEIIDLKMIQALNTS